MNRASNWLLVGAGALSLIAHQAWAHHAFTAEFDGNAPVLLKGPVTKVEWINPHVWLHMKVDDAGKAQEWMVEGGTPNALIRNGANRNSLKPGTEIVVRGYKAIDRSCKPACKANGRDITLPDGHKLFVGSSGTGAPDDNAEKPQN